MKSQKKPANKASKQQRRDFIKKTTLVGAGLAASSMASTAVIADVSTPEDKKEQKGYQLTQHVLDYYKSADV